MVFKRLSWLLLLAVSLWLTGCATSSSNRPTVIAPANAVAQQLGDARPGDIVDLPVGNDIGENTVVVGNDYTAASGRLCRRLRSTSGAMLSRVVCQRESGEWYSPRSLYSNKVSSAKPLFSTPISSTAASATEQAVDLSELGEDQTQSIVAVELGEDDLQSTGAKVRSANSTIDTQKFMLEQGETLWSFSRRVTGNALNWNTIAELNNIDDSRRLAAGDALLVPKSLVRGEP